MKNLQKIIQNKIYKDRYSKLMKGFTIIELLVYMGLLSISAAFITLNINGFSNITNNLDYTLCDQSIINFINNGKQYCREKKISGKICFLNNDKSIIFYCSGIRINKYDLPTKFVFTKAGNSKREIGINEKGITGDACTIAYKDRKGKVHEITISVGTAHVEIK
ncbi:type II secretion system protein [Clostridium lundense]|uniref:type II secretion system protein n=1 Tax=Clostridium lundense TaxID=319475 RepID=UPI0006881F2B|nr:type II secretion system protein [Clostridium lundense]